MNATETALQPAKVPAAPYFHHHGESELRWMGRVRSHFLATGASTDGGFCLVDESAFRGDAVPLHRHPEDMESFFVLEGEITLFIGGQPGRFAGPGAFAHVPAGTVHGFRVESSAARYLLLTTPQHGEFYRAITLPSNPEGGPPAGRVTGDMIHEACRRYRIEYVGPLPET